MNQMNNYLLNTKSSSMLIKLYPNKTSYLIKLRKDSDTSYSLVNIRVKEFIKLGVVELIHTDKRKRRKHIKLTDKGKDITRNIIEIIEKLR